MKYPNLKAEMARAGIGTDELAKQVGVHPNTINSWMKGTTPSVEKALEVSDALGVDVRYLFAKEPITPTS